MSGKCISDRNNPLPDCCVNTGGFITDLKQKGDEYMKKILKAILIVTAVLAMLAMTACRGSDDNESTKPGGSGSFRVGFSRINILPEESVPLGGYGNTSTRMSDGALDYIYAQVIAITDEKDESVVLVFLDAVRAAVNIVNPIKESISNLTGIPVGNVYVSASHSHSTPDTTNQEQESISRYNKTLTEWVTEAFNEAYADRKPATMYIGETDVDGLNFVRHYLLEDGTWAGDNFGHIGSSPVVRHESDADPTMRALCFKREDADDIFIANWQCHPTFFGKANIDVSGDFVAKFREISEKKLNGVKVVYAQGASGNLNPRSNIVEETPTTDYKVYGDQLSEYAVQIYNNLTQVETGDIHVVNFQYEGNCDHSEDDKVYLARPILEYWHETNNYEKAVQMANEVGLNGPYHANGIISKANRKKTERMNINAVVIGDINFITAPYEMFDITANYIRDNAGNKQTFVFGYSCGSMSYLPTMEAYDHGCYEKDVTIFERGTAEILGKKFVELIKEAASGK